MLIVYLLIALIVIISVILVWKVLLPASPCPVYLSWLVEFDNPFTKANHARVIVENLSLKPEMKVVDIGCGPGRITIPIAQRLSGTGEVTAMDIQSGMLDRVRAKAEIADIHNIKYLNAGIGEGKLTHNHFDRALLVTVLGEVPNKRAALKEVFDALKSEGILSVTETIFDPHFQKSKNIIKLATQVGFKKHSFIGNRFAFTLLFIKP
jgi:ubiquinone/menaquinone biosynthesis C-methylase UbiE